MTDEELEMEMTADDLIEAMQESLDRVFEPNDPENFSGYRPEQP